MSTVVRRRPSPGLVLAGIALAALFVVAVTPAAHAGDGAARSAVRATATRAAIRPAPHPMTALQLSARHGLTYRDGGTYVLLEHDGLRVRIYPGTSMVVVAGREYRVKDPALRDEKKVVLSKRVAGFLEHKIGAYRAEERTRKRPAAPRRKPRYEPLPPLPPRPKLVKRAPRPQRRLGPSADAAAPRAAAKPAAPDRDWAPPVSERRWKWIILHHSDDTRGDLAKYDDYHRNERGWEHGCGYHFVVGNGSLSGDGEVEVGPRWRRQLHGAHAKTPDNRFNDHGIGVCLVGDFNEGGGRPTSAQMDELVRLVRWLRARYDIPLAEVKGHCDCCSTACPGRNFPWAELRRRIR